MKVSTLVLWGSRDRVIDVSCATRFAELIPNCELTILNDVGHVPMVEVPVETAARQVAFIESHLLPQRNTAQVVSR